jgi:HD-GYP domain-containing protein (c-di-GMP phosphodiesterase class II)
MARLAELIGGLVLASDLVNGFPAEKVLRTVVLTRELARCAAFDEEVAHDAYYVALFRFLGCTGFAHEEAHIYGAGDDATTRNVMAMADVTNPVATLRAIATRVGSGGALRDRARAVAMLVLDTNAMHKHARAQCDSSIKLAEIAGLSQPIRDALSQVCERYDGRGAPLGKASDALSLPTRLLHVADIAELAHHRFGEAEAISELERRSGKQLDPTLVRVFRENARPLFDAIAGPSVWDRFLELEPTPHTMTNDVAEVARVFALFADLKSVFTLGHSTGVAEIVRGAADGLPEDAVRDLTHAALLHDLGRVSVATNIWDKPAPLSAPEWERVRLHAYYTDRMMRRAPAWSAAARIAASAHERLDGSGYHRAVPGSVLGRQERLLAAADMFHALTEPRPHRGALTREQAIALLHAEVKRGVLDSDAVDAVLGARRPTRSGNPRGLSDREVEVLRLVARGKSNKEIGTLLGISARTVQHHVAHIYDKIGVYSRAGAALFVTENALLDER